MHVVPLVHRAFDARVDAVAMPGNFMCINVCVCADANAIPDVPHTCMYALVCACTKTHAYMRQFYMYTIQINTNRQESEIF